MRGQLQALRSDMGRLQEESHRQVDKALSAMSGVEESLAAAKTALAVLEAQAVAQAKRLESLEAESDRVSARRLNHHSSPPHVCNSRLTTRLSGRVPLEKRWMLSGRCCSSCRYR